MPETETLLSPVRQANFADIDPTADAIYFDEETGMLMRSVTIPGGDVEQVPYEP